MRSLGFLAGAVAGVACSTASAQTFDNFRTFCLDEPGDPLEAAGAAGWTEMDGMSEAVAATGQMGLTILTQPSSLADPVREYLMAGTVVIPQAQQAGCSTRGREDRETLRSAMTAWAGFAPTAQDVWFFTRGPEGVEPRPDLLTVSVDALGEITAQAGPLHYVMIGESNDGPFLMLTLFE